MDPFLLRCETCHARLKVRDERFLGQVQACPKCGSMVHIVAPVVEATPDLGEMAAAAASASVDARIVSLFREHTLLWSAGAVAIVATGSLITVLALRGGEEPAPASTPVAAVVAAETIDDPAVARPLEQLAAADPKVASRPMPMRPLPEVVTRIEPAKPVSVVETELVADASAIVEPPTPPEQPRTLTLEPVAETAMVSQPAPSVAATPEYSEQEDSRPIASQAQPPVEEQPKHVTNVKDQLAVPIESIDLPAMPIGEFVKMVSGMAAVPIRCDAKVLGDVGLSSRTTVTVRAEDATIGELLANVLNSHDLTYEERDGVLVIVAARRN